MNDRLLLHIQSSKFAHKRLEKCGASTPRSAEHDKHLARLQATLEIVQNSLLGPLAKEFTEA